MIVVEGPDNAGKTTLVNQLQKDLSVVFEHDIVINHAGGPGFTSDKLMANLAKLQEVGLNDRASFISEPIYATALERDTDADYFACVALTNSLLVHKAIMLIHVTGEINRLMDFKNHEVKAHETQEHVTAVMHNQRKIIMHYGHFMAPFVGYKNYHKYDYTIDKYTALLNQCIIYLTKRGMTI